MASDEVDRPIRSRFFYASAWLIAALIVLSFPQTYFGPLATGAKPFILLRHLHGLAFFAFTALFVWQALLVRRGRIRAHREWGVAGAALAGAMLPLGLWLAVTAIQDRATLHFALPFEFALYNLVDIGIVCGLIGWSIYEATRRIDWHRRLVFVAMLNLLGPAASR